MLLRASKNELLSVSWRPRVGENRSGSENGDSLKRSLGLVRSEEYPDYIIQVKDELISHINFNFHQE